MCKREIETERELWKRETKKETEKEVEKETEKETEKRTEKRTEKKTEKIIKYENFKEKERQKNDCSESIISIHHTKR